MYRPFAAMRGGLKGARVHSFNAIDRSPPSASASDDR
jgi:hypothetical protein